MDQRLTVHAALADEHRLAIADALALGDLTPGDLAQRIAVSSNLLAHHLAVLEDAGIVDRHKSEGDRRRTYVSLRWDNPVVAATVMPPPPIQAPRVVFVCTHNSARSQFAASLFASTSDTPVASGGTAPADDIHPLALTAMTAAGLAPLTETPQEWSTISRPDDMVIAVCDNAFESMRDHHAVSHHWSVPDPARTSDPTQFARTLSAIDIRVKRLAASLNPRSTS